MSARPSLSLRLKIRKTRRPRLRAATLGLALGTMLSGAAWAQATFQTSVPSAILVDGETGAILFEKEADRPFQPASLAKVMTANVVFDQLKSGKITPETPFVVSVNAWRRGGGPSGGAAMFADVNKPVRVVDLLAGALVVSGNDAAITLAEGVAGTESEFAGLMNEAAGKIGMTHSSFRNATGFADAGQVTTARDMAILARHIVQTYPDYYPVFAQEGIDWNKIKQRNRNQMLNAGVGADGLQTGWLKDVGYHALTSAKQNDQRLFAATMGAKSEKERLDETRRLLEWGFGSFRHRQVFAADQEVGRASVFGGSAGSVGLTAGEPVSLLTPRGGNEKISARVVYSGPLRAPVAKGAKVGHMEITRGQTKVLDVPLYTAADVPVGSLWDRALDGGFTLMGDSMRGMVQAALGKK